MNLIHQISLIICLWLITLSARAEIVVIISSSASQTTMDKDQISAIFLGKSATFPDGAQAIPVEQAEGTTPREEFHSVVTEKSASQLKSYWSKMVFSGKGTPPKEVPNTAEMLKLVAANPSTIGYVEKSAVNASVKIVFAP